MYYNLLKINGYNLVKPRSGQLNIDYEDKYTEYVTETGKTVIEQSRVGKRSGSVSYEALLKKDLTDFKNAIALVSDMTIYDPLTDSIFDIKALITNIKVTMIAHQEEADAWSLSFTFKEL